MPKNARAQTRGSSSSNELLWIYGRDAFILSLFGHFILIYFLLEFKVPLADYTKTKPNIIEVSFVRPIEKRKIISTNNAPESPIIPPKHFLSDKNSVTKVEQIKRQIKPGSAVYGTKSLQSPNKKSASVSHPVPKNQNIKSQPDTPVKPTPKKITSLKLDQDTLLKEFGVTKAPSQETPPTNKNYAPFSRSPGLGAAILGNAGSADFLPSLPDGDITLLNTKANQYAIFVRRVAISVFSNLQSSGWDSLRAQDIQSMNNFSSIKAILSPKGELVDFKILGRSGSERFDKILISAIKKGAKDRNPPAGARAADGNIHFVFQARSWVRLGGDSRGLLREQRWLLLQTGLD